MQSLLACFDGLWTGADAFGVWVWGVVLSTGACTSPLPLSCLDFPLCCICELWTTVWWCVFLPDRYLLHSHTWPGRSGGPSWDNCMGSSAASHWPPLPGRSSIQLRFPARMLDDMRISGNPHLPTVPAGCSTAVERAYTFVYVSVLTTSIQRRTRSKACGPERGAWGMKALECNLRRCRHEASILSTDV